VQFWFGIRFQIGSVSPADWLRQAHGPAQDAVLANKNILWIYLKEELRQ
jgi:hypothetical protein